MSRNVARCFTKRRSDFTHPTAALGHANPKVKEDTLTWLKEEVVRELKPALSKLAPLLLPAAAKAAEEAAPSLREAAMGFMVAFAIKVGIGAQLIVFCSVAGADTRV